jgi:hypothetical protein
MSELRKYGTETRVYFPLVDFGATDYVAGVTIAAGDATISKDAGAFANIVGENDDDVFVDEGGGLYSIKVAAAELQAKTVVLKIVDQTSPKEWEDQMLLIDTYGNASAQHPLDLGTALASQTIGTCTTNTDLVTAATIKTAIEAAGSHLALILEDTGTTLPTAIADVPTVSEFEARSLPSADYVVVGDTIAAVTTVNGLANDIITASAFDESTAFPLKSADTGATAVARTGADSDTLETLSDEIAALPTDADVTAACSSATPAVTVSDKTGFSLAANGASTETTLLFIKNVLEGDWSIDKSGTPWQIVCTLKSTPETELIRKDLNDVDGASISAVTTVIGQQMEPS